jgi:hypothetical protein
MMDCKQFREVMDLYVDGELSSSATAAASLHRAECPACDRCSKELSRLRSATAAEIAQVAIPAGFHQRMSEALDGVSNEKASKATTRLPLWPVWLSLGAIPVFLLMLITISVPARSVTANLLEQAAFLMDRPHTVHITGKLICRDCTLEKTSGMLPACERHGHHGALLTSDGRIWNIVEDDRSERLIHDSTLLGKEFRLDGVLYRQADAIQVERFLQLS